VLDVSEHGFSTFSQLWLIAPLSDPLIDRLPDGIDHGQVLELGNHTQLGVLFLFEANRQIFHWLISLEAVPFR
jgi:hypothetical protein